MQPDPQAAQEAMAALVDEMRGQIEADQRIANLEAVVTGALQG